jgi:hypothetical protein
MMAKTFDSVHETKQELFLYLLAKQVAATCPDGQP